MIHPVQWSIGKPEVYIVNERQNAEIRLLIHI